MSRIINIIRTSNNYFKISKCGNIRFMSYTTDNDRKYKTQPNLVKTNFDVINNDNKLKEYITRIYKYSGVVGLIGTNIMTLITSLCGFTNFANTMDFGATIVSTGVFTGLIVADTQISINDYKEKTLDTIKTSTELLLDATNLFIDIVKILIKLKKE